MEVYQPSLGKGGMEYLLQPYMKNRMLSPWPMRRGRSTSIDFETVVKNVPETYVGLWSMFPKDVLNRNASCGTDVPYSLSSWRRWPSMRLGHVSRELLSRGGVRA